jgi:HEAT repeat protein
MRTVLRRLLLGALAVACLGFEWQGHVPRLVRELEVGDVARRRDVVRRLAHHDPEQVSEAVLRALGDEDVTVRIEAAQTAATHRLRAASATLTSWLDDPDVAVREAAVSALGAIGDASAAPRLVRTLGDVDARVRRAAVGALARIGGREQVVALVGRLDDDDPAVRGDAARALARIGDGRAVVPLISRTRDPVPEVRGAVFHALGELGDTRALSSLLGGLRDDAEEARLAAIAALGRLGSPTAAEALAERAEAGDVRTRRAAVAALGRLPGAYALRTLVEALGAPYTASIAATALEARIREAAPTDRREAVVAVAAALERDEARRAAARLLAALARDVDLEPAAPTLLRVTFDAERPEPELLAALAHLRDDRVSVHLLERLTAAISDAGRGDAARVDAVARALEIHAGVGGADGRATEPILAARGRAPPGARPQLVALLGALRAGRAVAFLVPLLRSEDRALRLATVEALGRIGAGEATAGGSPDGAADGAADASPALVELLDDDDAELRAAAGEAIAAAGRPALIDRLAPRVRGPGRADRGALCTALGGLLARALERGDARRAATARDALLSAARSDDATLAAVALTALARAEDAGAAERLRRLLDGGPPSRAPEVLRALAALDDPQALAALRAEAAGGGRGEARRTAALGALGERGTEDDVPVLLDAARSRRFPEAAAAAFSLARLARRGLLSAAEHAPALCALAGARDPFVRANAVLALAALEAPCPGTAVSPIALLGPAHAEAVRGAAARWLASLSARDEAAGAPRPETARAALARCAAADPSADVARACATPGLPPLDEVADVVAYAPRGGAVRARALLALRLGDGTVLVARTDAAGRLRLPRAPRGALVLEDPLDTPLEPR